MNVRLQELLELDGVHAEGTDSLRSDDHPVMVIRLLEIDELVTETRFRPPSVIGDRAFSDYVRFLVLNRLEYSLPYVQIRNEKMTWILPYADRVSVHIFFCRFGGVYFDLDVLLLRDFSPILDREFAEWWGTSRWDINTAVLRLETNSSLIHAVLDGAYQIIEEASTHEYANAKVSCAALFPWLQLFCRWPLREEILWWYRLLRKNSSCRCRWCIRRWSWSTSPRLD